MTVLEEDLYDEFGNYTGPTSRPEEPQVTFVYDNEEGDEEESVYQRGYEEDAAGPAFSNEGVSGVTNARRQMIVPFETKQYYPDAVQVYGHHVETLVEEQDTQPLSQPIIAPIKQKRIQLLEPKLPTTVDDKDLLSVLREPSRIRNVVLLGQIHHGKTSLLDILVKANLPVALTHKNKKVAERDRDEMVPLGYTDAYITEKSRKITLKGKCMSVVSKDMQGTSYRLNLMDTPGHCDFMDETVSMMRIADGALLVVDAVEGVLGHTERLLRICLAEQLPVVLVVNKVDRLITELNLPPMDAYYKLRHLIAELNTLAGQQYFCPTSGNVLFASAQYGWCFDLRTVSLRYGQGEDFAKGLWGDLTLQDGRLVKATAIGQKRTFVSFVLEPLYKIHAAVMGEDFAALREFCYEHMGVCLKTNELKMNVKPLLELVLGKFFQWTGANVITEACARTLPCPARGAERLLSRYLCESQYLEAALACCDEGPLLAFCAKLYPAADDPHKNGFDALVRVFSGKVCRGKVVRVLGENFKVDDPDDSMLCRVDNVAFSGVRFKEEVDFVGAGGIALLSGIDSLIVHTATLVDREEPTERCGILRPIRYPEAHIKLALEPWQPQQLNAMLEAMKRLAKAYPALKTKVEESGEHLLFGTGELYLECAMHDLRNVFSEEGLVVRVAEPSVAFCESVADISYLKCFATSPNGKNKLTMLAEPLETELAAALENGVFMFCPQAAVLGRNEVSSVRIGLGSDPVRASRIASTLQSRFGWDALAARGFWGCGADHLIGTNVLVDDTLPPTDKAALQCAKEHVLQGFRWAMRSGPLCDEPVRGIKLRIVDAVIAKEPKDRTSGQIVPMVRRVCFSAMLTANPRMMEPVNAVEIVAPFDCAEMIYALLSKRRGHVVQDFPRAGSPLYQIKALLPVIECFGFETDLRVHSHGQAFCQQYFSHWQILPGDPLDAGIKLPLLEPSPGQHLGRDVCVKTRRRKGLPEDIAMERYFDDASVAQIAMDALRSKKK